MAASNGLPPRVPAWKRLGLKLKYAKEDVSDHARGQNLNLPASLGTTIGDQNLNESIENGRPAKKRRTSGEGRSQTQNIRTNGLDRHSTKASTEQASGDQQTPNGSRELLNDHIGHERLTLAPPDPVNQSNHMPDSSEHDKPPSRRKSVTFTPETKQTDGVSASALIKQPTADHEPASQEPTTAQRLAKKAKKKSDRKQAKPKYSGPDSRDFVQASIDTVPEYVRYLESFHNDRKAWKFNKKKQNDLLKNLFNLDRVPQKHDEAILQYLTGLQGSGPRQRVIESATSVLKDIAEKREDFDVESGMESDVAKLEAYQAALQRYLELMDRTGPSEYEDQQWEDMQREAERGKRADATLRTLLMMELYPNEAPFTTPEAPQTSPTTRSTPSTSTLVSAPTSTASTTKPISKRKNRKLRTQDNESSSSSSSSESEGGYKPTRGPSTVHAALSTRTDAHLNERWPVKATGTKKIFDDDLLDQAFPKKRTYHEMAPKRKAGEKGKARGFTYTHGTRADESGSEDE